MKEREFDLTENDKHIGVGVVNNCIGWYSGESLEHAKYIVNHWDRFWVFNIKTWGTKGYK